MSDLAQVTEHIRYGIDRLSSQNGHHEFEHLCRQFARLRISPFTIPATGPVSSGGDQGRDFETFLSFLSETVTSEGCNWLAAQHEGKKLAFACTLQRAKITSKVQRDVEAIAPAFPQVGVIYYFLGIDFPVSKRHYLQDWAKKEHGIDLEILDAGALSEQLSARDLFWIAQRYLRTPSEIYPPFVDQEDDPYVGKIKIWKGEGAHYDISYARFNELKELARYSLSEYSEDTVFWLSVLDEVYSSHSSNLIRYLASYEYLAIYMRLTRSFIGLEDRVVDFIGDVSDFQNDDEAENKFIIFSYACTAASMGSCNLEIQRLRDWSERLVEVAEDRISKSTSPSQRCFWLRLRGSLEFQIGITIAAPVDLNKVCEYWFAFVSEAEHCPLFPISDFKDIINEFVGIMENCSKFDEICSKLDLIISERAGKEAAADSCCQRGLAFYKNGNIIKAIKQFQKAKIGWFTEESLGGSLRACHLLSSFYEKLGLNFAAKYYALVEAFIAAHSSDPDLKARLPEALVHVAASDLVQGQWFSFWTLNRLIFITHHQFADAPWSVEHRYFWNHLVPIFQTKAITDICFPSVAHIPRSYYEELKLGSDFTDLEESANKSWHGRPADEIEESLIAQFDAHPWSDLGPTVEANWQALGVTWKFSWLNEYSVVASAEEIVALFQIAVVTLADFDTCMVGGEIEIRIKISSDESINLEFVPSNERSCWIINLPRAKQSRDVWIERYYPYVLWIIRRVVRSNSLLRQDDFERIMDSWLTEASENGFFGERYKVAYDYFWDPKTFDSNRSLTNLKRNNWGKSLRRGVVPLESKCQLADNIGEAELIASIHNRYERCVTSIQVTLNRLKVDESFQKTRTQLTEKGWKDWHFLLAVFNVAINHRFADIMSSRSIHPAGIQKMMNAYSKLPESENSSVIPIEKFSQENLEMHLNGSMLNTLESFGFHCSQQTPNLGAISDFLGAKLRYWDLDVEHIPFFEVDVSRSSLE